MLTANFASLSSYPQYMPQRPSPLSPRSANARSRTPFLRLDKMSDSEQKRRGLPQADRRNATNRFAFYRRNPLMKSSEDRTKLRNSAYLERVKTGQQDQRWVGKSDQACYHVYLQQ